MTAKPQPIVVTISHQLNRDEAKQRLDRELGEVRRQLAPFASAIDYRWNGYRLEFGLNAMWQNINGRIEIEDRLLRIELFLPLLLQMLSGTIADRIQSEGLKLLGGPAP